ncbi:SDR family oxidoreductase [Phycicoccus sp. CSK15P-2]|uniref:SDR family NAD(P)-dependent oxidoreductase n=1 Tax=Phycicoccus sp. CSK15P-2 TaxID=2807627 RepID=UPI0019500D87|nr:SDR family oxidoreductase [Phycicoccus sp. CSK15P-2]MBM6404809.1 SDR family oxidoreductase [Phycicoccus sp. CSK15P-2]
MASTPDQTTVVVGASRGIGSGVAEVLAYADVPVVAVSRTRGGQSAARDSGQIREVLADATDSGLPARIFDEYQPTNIIIVAGAVPHMRRLQEQSWDTFAAAWETDVRITFQWVREALMHPLAPGGRFVVFSSGAALGGSPLSGGYAGAKATQRFVTDYARWEVKREGLDLAFTSIMSKFSPTTGVGRPAVAAYAAQAGMPIEEFLKSHEPLLTPRIAGHSILKLLEHDAAEIAPAYLLDGGGLKPL